MATITYVANMDITQNSELKHLFYLTLCFTMKNNQYLFLCVIVLHNLIMFKEAFAKTKAFITGTLK